MARVTLNKNIKTYSGKLPPSGNRFYLTNRYGKEIMSHYPEHRDPDTISENQQRSMSLMSQASALAKVDLNDPVKHEEWLRKRNADYQSWSKYKTLRGYVVAFYMVQLQADNN